MPDPDPTPPLTASVKKVVVVVAAVDDDQLVASVKDGVGQITATVETLP